MHCHRRTWAATAAFVVACADPVRITEIPLELADARASNGISIVDLGSISADGSSNARDVNSSGVIVGYAFTKKYEPGAYTHAIRWSVDATGAVIRENLMSVLALPPIADALAFGVNTAGTVVGIMRNSDAEYNQGFVLSSDGATIRVGSLPRCDGAVDQTNYSTVRDINNKDEIVGEKAYFPPSGSVIGYSFYADLTAATPCVVELPRGAAYAINDNSVIVGENAGSGVSWTRTAGVWTTSNLGRAKTRAWSINTRGDVAGQFSAVSTGIDQRALLWKNSGGALVERELGALDAATQSVANGIDDSGRVVGWAQNRQLYMRAFDWTDSTGMRDLGTLGRRWSSAQAVSGKRIVGDSEVATPGREITAHATLWIIP